VSRWRDHRPTRRATTQAEALSSSVLLPYVRYSADTKKLYEDAPLISINVSALR
jgi:hypothetical protein